MKITKELFIEQAILLFGPERVQRQEHTIRPCSCDSSYCSGWRMDIGEEDNAVFGFPERLNV